MTGKFSLALTERDRAIVREVARCGVMTREQFIRLRLFASKTRANERLKRLVDHGYLKTRRLPLPVGGPRFVYLPGRLGRDGREATRAARFIGASDLFVTHQLGLVDIRIAFERHARLTRWLSESDLVGLSLRVVPDAYVEYEIEGLTYCAFVEYDRGTETLARIERKVRAYLDLAQSGRFARTFARTFFRVLIIADALGRLATLVDTAKQITDRIFRFTTLSELIHQGPPASIWRRPGVTTSESLTHS